MSAFPGQFGYVELLNLDVRDLKFWFIEAQKKLIQDQLKRIQASRLAMVENDKYDQIVHGLESQLRELKFGKTEIINQSWDELKTMRRG